MTGWEAITANLQRERDEARKERDECARAHIAAEKANLSLQTLLAEERARLDELVKSKPCGDCGGPIPEGLDLEYCANCLARHLKPMP